MKIHLQITQKALCNYPLRKFVHLFIFFLLIFNSPVFVLAQCMPPSADNCEDANVFCSLDELNGYSCSNPAYSNPTGCSPLCPSGGSAFNTSWWAFVCDGGMVAITITFQNCSVNGTGVKMGIWGDCDCAESIACNPNCNGPGQFTITANLTACKSYYMFVDGCVGDICDFTITTSGGSQPKLSPLGKINDDPDRKIQVCKGSCNKNFKVDGQNGNCEATYEWTLDGDLVGRADDNIDLNFPDEGDFQLCVTAYIGNPDAGSICDQEGPECVTIKVEKLKDKIGATRNICQEKIPYDWFGEIIRTDGEYRHTFVNTNCCTFDSILYFHILPKKISPQVYFIGCDTIIYVDTLTNKSYPNCNNQLEVFLPKSSIDECDSSYFLTTSYPRLNVQWNVDCKNGDIELSPLITLSGECNATNSESYKWYVKSDTNKTNIGTKNKLIVSKKEEYCISIMDTFILGTDTVICIAEYCDPYDESELNPTVTIYGELSFKKGDLGIFSSTYSTTLNKFYWNVVGGIILTSNSIDSNLIRVLWDSTISQGQICLSIETPCTKSPEVCIDVKVNVPVSTSSVLTDHISIIPNPNSGLFYIKGLEIESFVQIELYSLNGVKLNGGQYFSKAGILEFNINEKLVADGAYYLQVIQDSGIFVKKIMVNRK